MLSQVLLAATIVNVAPVVEERPQDPPITPWVQRVALAEFFTNDPLLSTDIVIEGDALDRISWRKNPPAFRGDLPGSLTARYDSTAEPGLFGFPLSSSLTQEDPWVAGFTFVIESEDFVADPFGFFQISFGLWNSQTTGLERTGTLENFATDTFDLVEFDYFPNVSPDFGGPFVSPTVLGPAVPDDPFFPGSGAFANAAFGFGPPAELPLDTPLIALIVNDPNSDEVAFWVFEVDQNGQISEVPNARTVVSTSFMVDPNFSVDTIGLTLWRDGFGGEPPSVVADVTFHGVAALSLNFIPRRLERLFPMVFGADSLIDRAAGGCSRS